MVKNAKTSRFGGEGGVRGAHRIITFLSSVVALARFYYNRAKLRTPVNSVSALGTNRIPMYVIMFVTKSTKGGFR